MAVDFLLEIGVEEMPARFLNPALVQLKELAEKHFGERRLKWGEIRTYGTPRRLALLVRGLAETQEPLIREVKGPAVKVAFNDAGEPTRAAIGFARSQGVGVDDLVTKTVGPVEYVFAVKEEAGRPVAEVLVELIPELVMDLHFPRSMRWGDLDVRFVRPIRWLVALLGEEVLHLKLAGVTSGRTTYGHRFLTDGGVDIDLPARYVDIMREAWVLVDPEERKESIWRQVQELAAVEGGRVDPDDDLLEEVTNLVEYPTALCGSFSESFLELPEEVLVTTMREHQRYFPLRDHLGRLMPKFIAVRNGGSEYLDVVRRGNERVLRARLADAVFFWREDLKTPLADKVDGLKKIIFHEKLGTVYQKVQRVGELAAELGRLLGVSEGELSRIRRAAELCKADLVTSMVYEFPELQGIMGREYALRSGEEPAVADAIFEHYLPRFAGDQLPVTTAGRILSVADKLDNLVSCFAIGIQPTGSQDPYALRRQALGICHIMIDGDLRLSLSDLIRRACEKLDRQFELELSWDLVEEQLVEFFRQRLRGLFVEKGLRYDTVEAVLAVGCDDISDTWWRVRAVEEFRSDPAFESLLTVYTRAFNLSKNASGTSVDPGIFSEPAEKELYRAFEGVREKVLLHLQVRDYGSAMSEMTSLYRPVNRFFDEVMVMVEDDRVRENRLALLKGIASLAGKIAEFSKIV